MPRDARVRSLLALLSIGVIPAISGCYTDKYDTGFPGSDTDTGGLVDSAGPDTDTTGQETGLYVKTPIDTGLPNAGDTGPSGGGSGPGAGGDTGSSSTPGDGTSSGPGDGTGSGPGGDTGTSSGPGDGTGSGPGTGSGGDTGTSSGPGDGTGSGPGPGSDTGILPPPGDGSGGDTGTSGGPGDGSGGDTGSSGGPGDGSGPGADTGSSGGPGDGSGPGDGTDTGSPSGGDTGSPSSGDTGSPSSGDTGSPSSGDTGTPSSGDGGDTSGGCVGTIGYWKNHPEVWSVSELTIGAWTYDETELMDLLGTAPKGDVSIQLARQLIAAELAIAAGADDSAISGTIDDAQQWMLDYDDGDGLPYGVSSYVGGDANSLIDALDDYNSGLDGIDHC